MSIFVIFVLLISLNINGHQPAKSQTNPNQIEWVNGTSSDPETGNPISLPDHTICEIGAYVPCADVQLADSLKVRRIRFTLVNILSKSEFPNTLLEPPRS